VGAVWRVGRERRGRERLMGGTRGQRGLVVSGWVWEGEAVRCGSDTPGGSTVPPDSVFKPIQTESNLFKMDLEFNKL
jgi:hypothetical protein